MSKTKISWTERTWNPLAGCTRASEGCDNCYAAVMSHRLEAMALADIVNGKSPGKKAKYIGTTSKAKNGHIAFNGKINLDYDALNEPYAWKKPVMVFVNSMSDLFHKDVPLEFVAKVFQVMVDTPQHTYQVLTKRPERMEGIIDWIFSGNEVPSHIWLGTSVENQEQANIRIPHLIDTNAKIRFLSCEPLLGGIDLAKAMQFTHEDNEGYGIVPLNYLSWIIAGGESGKKARPVHPNWLRLLRDQCASYDVPYFLKQWGEYAPAGEWYDTVHCFLMDSRTGMQSPVVGGWKKWNDAKYYEPMRKFGKKMSGNVLDGKVWQEFPVIGGD
jgi:protein gp37